MEEKDEVEEEVKLEEVEADVRAYIVTCTRKSVKQSVKLGYLIVYLALLTITGHVRMCH